MRQIPFAHRVGREGVAHKSAHTQAIFGTSGATMLQSFNVIRIRFMPSSRLLHCVRCGRRATTPLPEGRGFWLLLSGTGSLDKGVSSQAGECFLQVEIPVMHPLRNR